MKDIEVYPKMFTWLAIGLLVSFITGYSLSIDQNLMMQVLSIGIIPIIVIELVVAFIMGLRIQKMQPITAKICYIIYSITTGLTLSTIFIAYEMSSIISIFAITAFIFGLLAFYGYTTKKDLSKLGNILFIGLIGVLVGSLVNIFLRSPITETIISAVCVLIFTGYIAYDINNVKYMLPAIGEEKTAVYGAFQLYLDFINLFIRLLRLFGKSDD